MRLKLTFLFLFTIPLAGCIPPPQPLMSPLQYHQPIALHLPMHAFLYGRPGKVYSSEGNLSAPNGAGLLATLISVKIQESERRTHPKRYEYHYGIDQQRVFIRSLKNILQKNHVFSSIEWVNKPVHLRKNDVLITVYFKETRVGSPDNGLPTILDTQLTIQTAKKRLFKRHYFLQSIQKHSFLHPTSYKTQRQTVSQRLLNRIIHGIKTWGKRYSN